MSKIKKAEKKIRKIATYFIAYMSIVGLITFSNFIFEEAIQMTTFGTWPAQDAKAWEIVLEGADLIDSINLTMKIVNYGLGWIQPLAFLSYRAYARATDFYTKALKTKAFAHAPEIFIGRRIRFKFTPRQITSKGKCYDLSNRNLHVFVSEQPQTRTIDVDGVLEKIDGKLIIYQGCK
jgi:hypothetical protein